MPAVFSRRSVLGLLAGTAMALAGAGPAAATSFAPVLHHAGAALPAGARNLGRVAPGAELRLTVALRPRHAAALAAYAAGVSTAGSLDYHRYLTVAQFARRFGPSVRQLRLVRAGLRARGLRVGATSANRLSILVRGSARVAVDAFGTPIERYVLRSGAGGYGPVGQPRLSGVAGALLQGVVGLDSIAPRASVSFRHAMRGGRPVPSRGAWRGWRAGTLARARPGARTHASGHLVPGGPRACGAASREAAQAWGYTPAQIAGHYGLSGFHAAGDGGAGVTVALYELEPFAASDIAAYQACMGTSTAIGVTPVDGGPGTGPGSGEAATDIEDVIGLAPKARIQVYEGPLTGQGAYDTYSAIVSQDAAQVVSTSWGLCEPEVGRSQLLAEDTLFQEAAVQGQTILAAAGDTGTDDCGNGQPAVDDPSSQPWVTSVGGTHLLAAGDTVWDDAAGATGGGASSFWPRPVWQAAVPAQTAVTCGAAGVACREVPDISADADPATGYTVFFRGSWQTVGGTSVAAPTIAALTALAEAAPGCGGRRLGFLNPALYADAADIQDVTSGAN
ncbi:MAG TPA: S53 family peptidase, partial [Solirubrobacteraceae bacterium]|nr:S53 family peptidase [Solirubrobacteraceae bacterium]